MSICLDERNPYVMCQEYAVTGFSVVFDKQPTLVMHYGYLRPGSSAVGTIGKVETSTTGKPVPFTSFIRPNYTDMNVTYNSTEIVVSQDYMIVGLAMHPGPIEVGLWPIVSPWNKDIATTWWNGKGGTIYEAKAPSGTSQVAIQAVSLEDTADDFNVGGPEAKNDVASIMRGLRLESARPQLQLTQVRAEYVKDSLTMETRLPFALPETPGINYVQLPNPFLT